MLSSDLPSVEIHKSQKSLHLKSSPDSIYPFDQIFGPSSSQKQVFDSIGLPIVKSLLLGFNGTVLAYGQTSSGKTFTMIGPDISDPSSKGLIPRISKTIFEEIQESDQFLEFSVKVSFCELYLEKIRDLLSPKQNLKISEDKTRGVFIRDLSEFYVASEKEVLNLLRAGNKQREVAGTLMNEESSRSHAMFLVTISQHNTLDLSVKTGKLFLVDLAGSEKLAKSAAEGKRLDETKNINKSLSALGNVISALTDGKSAHVPYRDSKLTRVLSESLGGNSKTSLIVTVSSAFSNENETVSTLRFGLRAKAVKNKPVVNKELSLAELKLMLNNANEGIRRKDLKIKWLQEKIVEFTQDEDILKEGFFKEEPEQKEIIDEGFFKDRLLPLEEEVRNLKMRNNELLKENDNLNGKVCHLNSLVEEYQEKIMELNDSLVMSRFKIEELEQNSKTFEETIKKLETLFSKQSEKNENLLESKEKISNSFKFTLETFETCQKDPEKVLVTKETLQEILSLNQSESFKVKSLEKNLEQLNLMYQVMSNKCSSMKNDLLVYEKKSQRKNERITHLEKNLKKAAEQVNHIKYKLEQVNKEDKNIVKDHPKIKKMIKGGSLARGVNILCPYSLNIDIQND
jgi:kinesin family protein 5